MTTHYAIAVDATDKHPGTPDDRTKLTDTRWLLPVQIIEGYSTLDRETVTKILTISHGTRLDNITPIVAFELNDDGTIGNPVTSF